MDDHFGVARRLENRGAVLEPPTQFERIGQVTVVAQRELALVEINRDRLRVDQRVVSGSGIPRVADGGRAGQPLDHLRRENFLHVPQAPVQMQVHSVG